MARLLKGAPVAAAITAETSERAHAFSSRTGRKPSLALVRVGERPDDMSYERAAMRRAEKAGVDLAIHALPAGCATDELLSVIDDVNGDDAVDGCLMFRPLPGGLDEAAACRAIAPAKDVDGVTAGSLYGVFAAEPVGFAPCTAEAVLEILEREGIDLDGSRVAVIGRSMVIGRPVAMMLMARNSTVTICHTHTRDVASVCREADIVVAAAGAPGTFRVDCARPGQCIIDVGINWDATAGKLVGDVDFDAVCGIVSAITPVPGGVGAVTTAVLMKHVVEAAYRRLG